MIATLGTAAFIAIATLAAYCLFLTVCVVKLARERELAEDRARREGAAACEALERVEELESERRDFRRRIAETVEHLDAMRAPILAAICLGGALLAGCASSSTCDGCESCPTPCEIQSER